MKRRTARTFCLITLVILTLLGTGCVSRSPQPTEVITPTEPARIEAPFLYEFAGVTGKSYLFGTIHAGVDADDLPPVVWSALEQTRCFMMEADVESVDPEDVARMARLPEGQSLQEQLTPQEWQTLVGMMPQFPPHVLNQFKPWMAVTLYWQTIAPEMPAMDLVLRDKVRRLNHSVYFLEESLWQLRLLEQVTTRDDLKELIHHRDEMPQLLADMVTTYRGGQESALEKVMFEPRPGQLNQPRQTKLLLDDRNKRWVPEILKRTQGENCFVAVGAGHLFGPHGLLQLLQRRGIRLTRIPAAP